MGGRKYYSSRQAGEQKQEEFLEFIKEYIENGKDDLQYYIGLCSVYITILSGYDPMLYMARNPD
jgi:hypothetical protein